MSDDMTMISDVQQEALIAAALAVRDQAYVPYSNYQVGAAILLEDGQIMTGVNVENASFGLTVCAERTAVFKAVTAGYRRLTAVAVATDNAGSPCGACRQVLVEFAGDIPIWLVDSDGRCRRTTLHQLLPDHFGPEYLPG